MRGLRGYADVRRALGGRRFDALLHMHASARANLVSLLVRAPLRIGFDRARARDQQWLFTNSQAACPARAPRHGWPIRVRRAHRRPARHTALGSSPSAPTTPRRSRRYFANGKPTLVISPARVSAFATTAIGAWSRMPRSPITRRSATAPRCSDGRHHGHRAELRPRHRRHGQDGTPDEPDRQDDAEAACSRSCSARASCCAPTPGRRTWRRPSAPRSSAYTPRRTATARARTSASTSSSTSTPRPWRSEFGRPVETLRWGQRVRDPAAMSLITVADVTAKLDCRVRRARHRAGSLDETAREGQPWIDIRYAASTTRPRARSRTRWRRPRSCSSIAARRAAERGRSRLHARGSAS